MPYVYVVQLNIFKGIENTNRNTFWQKIVTKYKQLMFYQVKLATLLIFHKLTDGMKVLTLFYIFTKTLVMF